jgi:hypothetical protein
MIPHSFRLKAIPEHQPSGGAVFSRASSGYRVRRDRRMEKLGSGRIRSGYSPVTGEFLGWLIAAGNTNLLKTSSDFRSSSNGNPVTAWGNSNITVTADAVASPDGSTTADTIAHTSNGSLINQTISGFSAGAVITASVYAKRGNVDYARIELGNSVSCWYNLNAGTVGTNGAGSGNVLFSRKFIEALPNGFVRCGLTVTTSSITSMQLSMFATASDGVSSASGNTVNLWGAMANVGPQAPYIESTTAATAYSADIVTLPVSVFLNQFTNENTVLYEFRTPEVLTGPQTVWSLDDGTASERICLYLSSGVLYLDVVAGGATLASLNLGALSANAAYRCSAGIKAGSVRACINGGSVVSGSPASLPAPTTFRLGCDYASANFLHGYFKDMEAFPAFLSDADLQRLSA